MKGKSREERNADARIRNRKRYEKSSVKTALRIKMRENREERIAFRDQIKESGCLLCGEKEKYCLDFHHIEQKTERVSELTSAWGSFDRYKSEIDKCVLLCSNCHRKVHAGLLECPRPQVKMNEVTQFELGYWHAASEAREGGHG